MAERDALAERVAAVERALTDGDADADEFSTPDDLSDRVAALESDLADLEAAVQALRGYVGEVRRVDREVERTAEAALAAATDSDDTEGSLRAPTGDPLPGPAGDRTDPERVPPGSDGDPDADADRELGPNDPCTDRDADGDGGGPGGPFFRKWTP